MRPHLKRDFFFIILHALGNRSSVTLSHLRIAPQAHYPAFVRPRTGPRRYCSFQGKVMYCA
jgi:hypothetical protein